MKLQFVTHTTGQTEIPAVLDISVTNTPSVKMLCPQNTCLFLYCSKNVPCWSVGLLRTGQVFFFLL